MSSRDPRALSAPRASRGARGSRTVLRGGIGRVPAERTIAATRAPWFAGRPIRRPSGGQRREVEVGSGEDGVGPAQAFDPDPLVCERQPVGLLGVHDSVQLLVQPALNS